MIKENGIVAVQDACRPFVSEQLLMKCWDAVREKGNAIPALDLKDSETEGHSKRVTAFTIAIARAMGLSAERTRVIARGAFLHDIGKMAIPDAILRKPGPLTDDPGAGRVRLFNDQSRIDERTFRIDRAARTQT